MKKCLNLSSLEGSKSVGSQIKTKIEYFKQTGELLKYTPQQYNNLTERKRAVQRNRIAKSSYSLQKALLVLKSKYDSHIFQNDNGDTLDLQKLTPKDLSVESSKSLTLFKNLLNFKKMGGKRADPKLIMTLLGTNYGQIRDPYLVTKEVGKLLERDKDIIRAEYLGRVAGSEESVVAMNTILEWLLQKGNVTAAFKHITNRKKWSIPMNEQTYIILFSGLARAYEWGKVPDEICKRTVEIFNELRIKANSGSKASQIKCETSHFNACLSLLVKNYSGVQNFAWSFFDLLLPDAKSELAPLYPDCQTFTIFLNGIKKHAFQLSDKIHENGSLSKDEKRKRLFVVHGQLIKSAEDILAKVFEAATPAVPPTKEEAKENPSLLQTYRSAARRPLMDIDEQFAVTFLSCLINRHSRTCFFDDQNSHYLYVKDGIRFLQNWCPEIDNIVRTIQEEMGTADFHEPAKIIKDITDSRMSKAIGDDTHPEVINYTPEKVLSSLASYNKNPLVNFPPPPFSKNKTKAIFSGKLKPLIDFSRPLQSDVRKVLMDKNYRTSRGKFGKKLSNTTTISLEKRAGVNKFLISLYLDGLLSSGKNKEFITSIWYILGKWGGISLDKSRLKELDLSASNFSGILKDEEFPKFIKSSKDDSSISPIEYASASDVDYVKEVVDVKLVEKFLMQINESFKYQGISGTRLSLEVIASIVNKRINIPQELKARELTFQILLGNLANDLHYYNDYNYNTMTLDKGRKNIPNNTPRKSITYEQLAIFLDNLNSLVNCLLVHESQAHKQTKYLLPNTYIDAYNRLIERVYSTTWIDAEQPQITDAHKLIIKSGILFYRPKALVNPMENLRFSRPILKSLEYVYQQLKENENLDKQDSRLKYLITSLFQLRTDSETARKRLVSLTTSIYDIL